MSEQSRTPADDPLRDRPPTSHERMTGLSWDASYHNGPPPWDIGRPQPAVVRLASEGGFSGAVLDAGCSTGENALHVASLGFGFWALMWRNRHWQSPARKWPNVRSRPNLSRRMHISWSVFDAVSTQCWIAACFTPATPTNAHAMQQVWLR